MMALRVTLLLLACAGCGESLSYWSIPEPFVRPGSRVGFFKIFYQTETTPPAWRYTKGDGLAIGVSKTRYVALDLATCAVRGTAEFPGATRELGWVPSATNPDLWIALDRDGPTKHLAHSLHRRSVELPSDPAYDPRWREAPIHFVVDRSDDTFRIWHVDDGRVEVTPWNARGFEAFSWSGKRAIAVVTTPQPDELELVVADAPGGTMQRWLSTPPGVQQSARLLPGGNVIGFLTNGSVDLFAIDDGHRVARYEIPPHAEPAWPAAEPGWFVYFVADGSAPAGTCRTRVVTIDLLHGATRSYDVGMCLGSPTWLDQSSIVLTHEYVSGTRSRSVAIDVATGRTGRAPANSKHWGAIGHTVFYTGGNSGHWSLMALDLEHGAARALTEDLGDVRFVAFEPSSHTVVLTRPESDVLLYHLDAHSLDLCTIR